MAVYPRQLRRRMGQREEAGRGRSSRRQGFAGARSDDHRRHRRRSLQGHRRAGDQPADQGDEPCFGTGGPRNRRHVGWAGGQRPALRDRRRCRRRDRRRPCGSPNGAPLRSARTTPTRRDRRQRRSSQPPRSTSRPSRPALASLGPRSPRAQVVGPPSSSPPGGDGGALCRGGGTRELHRDGAGGRVGVGLAEPRGLIVSVRYDNQRYAYPNSDSDAHACGVRSGRCLRHGRASGGAGWSA